MIDICLFSFNISCWPLDNFFKLILILLQIIFILCHTPNLWIYSNKIPKKTPSDHKENGNHEMIIILYSENFNIFLVTNNFILYNKLVDPRKFFMFSRSPCRSKFTVEKWQNTTCAHNTHILIDGSLQEVDIMPILNITKDRRYFLHIIYTIHVFKVKLQKKGSVAEFGKRFTYFSSLIFNWKSIFSEILPIK